MLMQQSRSRIWEEDATRVKMGCIESYLYPRLHSHFFDFSFPAYCSAVPLSVVCGGLDDITEALVLITEAQEVIASHTLISPPLLLFLVVQASGIYITAIRVGV